MYTLLLTRAPCGTVAHPLHPPSNTYPPPPLAPFGCAEEAITLTRSAIPAPDTLQVAVGGVGAGAGAGAGAVEPARVHQLMDELGDSRGTVAAGIMGFLVRMRGAVCVCV
jgi:hypothetical protein